jgi:HEAT repeat protein
MKPETLSTKIHGLMEGRGKRRAAYQVDLGKDPFQQGLFLIKQEDSLVMQAKQERDRVDGALPAEEDQHQLVRGPLLEASIEATIEEEMLRQGPLPTADGIEATIEEAMPHEAPLPMAEAAAPAMADNLVPFINDKDEEIRRAAIAGLGETGDPRAVEALKQAFANGDWRERRLIAQALNDLGWEYEKNEAGFYYCLLNGDWEACAGIGKFILPQLVSALASGDDADIRVTAALALGVSGDFRAVDPLMEALEDEAPAVREAAAISLGKLKRRKSVEALIEALQDEDEGVGRAAAGALVEIGEGSVEPLVAALQDRDAVRRETAARMLDKMGDIRNMQPFMERALMSALTKGDKWGRRRMASALGQIRKEWAVKPLIEALYYYGVREAARDALIETGEAGKDLLVSALRHRHISVRKAAAEILGVVGDLGCSKALMAACRDKDWCVREAAQEAIDSIQKRAASGDSVVLRYPIPDRLGPDNTASTA